MKAMSIARYVRDLEAAKTRGARINLFLRSLRLRYKLWRTQRTLDQSRLACFALAALVNALFVDAFVQLSSPLPAGTVTITECLTAPGLAGVSISS